MKNGATSGWSEQANPLKPDPLVGTTLNNSYVVERLLGQGGMGRVYEARHTRITKKRYAIKVLRAELADIPEVLARFQREAETAACISHPSVIGVYDVDRTSDGLPYLVCEYLEGMELGEYADGVGKVDTVTAVHICLEICGALEAAHAGGVIHRDLKPQNVFLVGNFEHGVPARPVVKVLDFGLSRFQDSSNTLTRTGMVMGTPSFMAPEQARGQKTDHRTDIYGVGAILYTLLTGRPPFGEDTPHLTVLAVMERDPPRPRSIDPSIPQHLELVVQRAMAKEPDDRYADITALKHALEPFTHSLTETLLRPGPAASRASLEEEAADARTARPRLLLMMVLAVALVASLLAMALVAVGVLTGWLTFRPAELALLMLGALGTSVTPGIILIRRIRRVVWNNTARVLDTSKNLSAYLLAGLLGYGAVTLLVRFADVVLVRFTEGGLFGQSGGSAWPGWDIVFPVVGGIAAAAVWLRRVILAEQGGWRRFVAGPVLYVVGLVAAGSVVYAGLTWRAATGNAPVIEAVPVAVSEPPQGAPTVHRNDSVAARSAGEPKEPAPQDSANQASQEELAAAVAGGVEGLTALAEKYPRDPDVLKPLVFAYASRSTGHSDAMSVAGRLFEVAPERADDSDTQLLLSKIARTSRSASEQALSLMAEKMGTSGPDLLYDLMLSTGKAADKAKKLLAKPAVQERFSPALRIAYDLRKAKTCGERLPLLERAASLGDERSIMVLAPLTQGSKRGCGKWRNKPCPPACALEAKRYNDAIATINTRIRGVK